MGFDGSREVLFSPGALGCRMDTKGCITSVSARGQAATLGLSPGDMITHLNGRPFVEVGTLDQLRTIEEIKKLREPFTLRMERGPPGLSPAEGLAASPAGVGLPPSTASGSASNSK